MARAAASGSSTPISRPISAGERSTSSPAVARAYTAARNAFARSRLSWFTPVIVLHSAGSRHSGVRRGSTRIDQGPPAGEKE